jgi:small-conductance mechanosensitive channel
MDFGRAWATIVDMVNGIIASLPNVVLALIIFLLFYFIAKRVYSFVAHTTDKRRKARNLGMLLGKLAQTGVIVAGLLVAFTVMFPSFKPSDLIQLLGIGSIAIGFAFRDVFQNFLAGILLLMTSPFEIGDHISLDDFEGTVENIQTRATTISTDDGCRIVIPNTDLFTHAVTVTTAFGLRRMEHNVQISNEANIDHTKELLIKAINRVEGVQKKPAAEAFVVALTDSSVTIRILWWIVLTEDMHFILTLQDKVLTTINSELFLQHVALPNPVQHIRLEQQTPPVTPFSAIAEEV